MAAKTKIRDLMTTSLCTLQGGSSLHDAAQAMRENDIGDVIVCDGDTIAGIVTDRDITIRGVADGKDPDRTTLADICSSDLVTLSPEDPVERAVELMRDRSLRRLPVVDGGRPVGIVSIGDLAIERDGASALADISAARGNR